MSLKTVVKNRVLEMFTENDGKLSLSRVITGAIAFVTIFWVSYLVFKNSSLPDLDGPAMFLGGAGASHYGLGKWFGKKDQPAIVDGALDQNSKPPDVTLIPGTELPKKN